jgi:tight adherence protein C
MDSTRLIVLAVASGAFFIGILIVVMSLLWAGTARQGVARGLSSIDRVYGAGARERSAPGAPPHGPNPIVQLGRAATRGQALARLRRWLDYAGNPPYWTVDRVFEVKGLGLIVVGIVGATIGFVASGVDGTVLGGIVGAAVGFFIPDLVIHDMYTRRQDHIRRSLPDILDTLTVSVEAGLAFDSALVQISRYGRGPVAAEFARVLQEMQIGRSRVDALRGLQERTTVVELRSFCAIVVQATELGVPIATVLREQAREMRGKRRQRAEEIAQKVPVKILFPLIFCLLPALFVVVLGPGIINILKVF